MTNFGEILRDIEPTLTDDQILGLYKKALELETSGDGHSDKICSDTVIDLIRENRIGGYGKNFLFNYLEKH